MPAKPDMQVSRESDVLQRDLKNLKTDLMLQQVAKKSENPPAFVPKPRRVGYPGSTKRALGPKKPLNDDLALVRSEVKEENPYQEKDSPPSDND